MNKKFLPLFAVLVGWSLSAGAAPPTAGGKDAAELLRQGLFEEEANRDLGKAAAAYAGVIELYDTQRTFAATAMFRLAEIRAQQGNKVEATALYQRLLAEFPNDDPLARFSRERLAALGAPAPAATSALSAPEAPTEEEARELARVRDLVKNSPDLLNAVADKGSPAAEYTPLNYAAAKGWARVAAFLLDHGAQSNGIDQGGEPLHEAAANGHKELVELLLTHGADLNAPTPDGWTALHAACFYRRAEIIRLLLDKGANTNVKFVQQFPPADTAQTHPGCGPVRPVVAAHEYYPDDDARGTPLLMAVQNHDDELAILLLDHGADPNLADTERSWNPACTLPLILALDEGQGLTAKLLMQRGAKLDGADTRGYTVLHAAARNTPALVPMLLDKGVRQTADANGYTPFFHGVISCHFEVTRDKGASSFRPLSPSELEQRRTEWLPALEALLAHGADVNTRDLSGETPLFGLYPTDAHLKTIAAWLLSHGANINAQDSRKQTMLHHYCHDVGSSVSNIVVAWLVEHGADTDLKDALGKRPFDLVEGRMKEDLERQFQYPQIIPRLARERAVNSLVSLRGWPSLSKRVMPASEFDAPPTLVGLMKLSLGEPSRSNSTISVHRISAGGTVAEAARLELHFGSEMVDMSNWPTLQWGDVVVFESDDDIILPDEVALGFEAIVKQQRRHVALQMGERAADLPLLVPVPGTADPKPRWPDFNGWAATSVPLPDWTLSELVAHLTAAEPRAQLDAIRLERTTDGQSRSWTLDLRAPSASEAESLSKEQVSPVKRLPGYLANGDHLIIPLRPVDDPAALTIRRGAICFAAPGGVFAERVFSRTADELGTHTLGELLMQAYLDPMVVPEPDFSKIIIHRLEGTGGAESAIPVDFARTMHDLGIDVPVEAARHADVPLQWGDVIDIATLPDGAATQWKGLDLFTRNFLKRALAREVPVTLDIGGTHREQNIPLGPSFSDFHYGELTSTFEFNVDLGHRPFSVQTLLEDMAIQPQSVARLTVQVNGQKYEYDPASLQSAHPWIPLESTVSIQQFTP